MQKPRARRAGLYPAVHLYDLVMTIQRRVRDETGVELVPEVRFAGPFEPATRERRNDV